jgi:hypothetical protein
MILFLVGAPGVGKTTLARLLLEPDPYLVQKPKWTVGETICAAGHYTGGTFDGADMVPYNGAKDALAYWAQNLKSKKLTIFDGDRFSNANTLAFLKNEGARITCVHLEVDDAELTRRREQRGSKQNASWMLGRKTKARRFAESIESYMFATANTAPDRLLDLVKRHLEALK